MNEIIYTDEFGTWFGGLTQDEQREVFSVVDKLEVQGLQLGHPHSSSINGATFALRELRPRAGASPIRIFYAYDPARDAVLIIGGDKSGNPRFYDEMLPVVERIWAQYLKELAEEEAKKKQGKK